MAHAIYTVVFVLSFFGMMCEVGEIVLQVIWSVVCMIVCGISGILSYKTRKK